MTGANPKSLALVVCFLFLLVLARSARADEALPRRLVVVLRPSPGVGDAWPDGTQAVIAELVAGGYELTLRASSARDNEGLLAELASVASERPVLGVVVVLREGERGVAYVYTQKAGTVAVETGVAEGAVGEGRLALRITQLLGPPHLDVVKRRPPDAATPPPTPDPVAGDEPRRHTLLAIAAGLVFSSDLTEPLPIAGLVARHRLFGPLSAEAKGNLSLSASRLETEAGNVDVSASEVTLHLAFEPFHSEGFGLSLGLGGGVVWLQGSGEPRAGFSATRDQASVALLSSRAMAFFTHKDWSLLLGIEPGVMLPAASVGGGDEVARLGRPWTTASVGLGWNL
jgi:hypothetical protein